MAGMTAQKREQYGEYMRCMIEAGTDPNTARLLYRFLQDCVMTAVKIKLPKDYSLTQEQSNERANNNSMHRQ